MLINRANLSTLFNAFNAAFTRGFGGAETAYERIAMKVPSGATEETYGWLGQFPRMREWVGDRIVQNLSAQTYTVKNRKFENTVSVDRDAIEDDRYGVFTPIMEELGRAASEHPDELVFSLLKQGFATVCYDGQYFFDTDHPVVGSDGAVQSYSNSQGGTGTPWFLLDTSRAVKPIVYQERVPYRLTALTEENDEQVFWNDTYVYGVRSRCNVGFGLWQLAFGSKQPLDRVGYAAARAAMMAFKGDQGRPLGVRPTLLVVPPSLEGAARDIIVADTLDGGGTNPWKGSAELVVTPWLA